MAIGGFVAPAWGSCGDYLNQDGRKQLHGQSSKPLVPQTPCHGPQCSGQPTAPVPVPVLAVTMVVEKWAAAATVALAEATSRHQPRVGIVPILLDPPKAKLERPPRPRAT